MVFIILLIFISIALSLNIHLHSVQSLYRHRYNEYRVGVRAVPGYVQEAWCVQWTGVQIWTVHVSCADSPPPHPMTVEYCGAPRVAQTVAWGPAIISSKFKQHTGHLTKKSSSPIPRKQQGFLQDYQCREG